ncbi:hypothetical protein OS493_019949 [Desmophyllum pertusum]|uniref:Uncharacterized protein n=1 Tax=Desmophyllum pertusum TaxID=174260 RepID=A0A9W9YN24_9CNID|nr:hypothetical protein OS493_019949 [Desmophyllum pertusum]
MEDRKVVVAAPLAILANGYSDIFQEDVTCDTIHSLFRIPVAADQQHTETRDSNPPLRPKKGEFDSLKLFSPMTHCKELLCDIISINNSDVMNPKYAEFLDYVRYYTPQNNMSYKVSKEEKCFDRQLRLLSVASFVTLKTNQFPVFKDMQVIITKNRDKKSGIINGQRATVINSQNNTVLCNSQMEELFSHILFQAI